MENFPVGTGGHPQRFPPGFTAVTPHPGALAPFGLGPNGQGRHIDIDPQQALSEAMVRGLAVALQVIPGHPAELLHRRRSTRLQRARNGRLLGTTGPPKRPLHRRIKTNGAITLGDRLGATEDPQQPIEEFVDRAIADALLGKLHLFSQRGKETVPFEILA